MSQADATKAQNPSARKQLTYERLRELMHYDPQTGVLTNIVDRSLRAKAGCVAGTVEKRGRNFYVRISIDYKHYYGHRLAWLWMTGEWPVLLPDHRDGDGLNNKWANLRAATYQQNGANAILSKNNTSGHRGVSLRRSGRWRAYVTQGGNQKNLGSFTNKDDAARAAAVGASEAFGEFVRK